MRALAHLRWIAGDGKHVADAFRVRAEQHRLEPEDRPVARGQVRDRLDSDLALDRRRHHQRAHPCARRRVVVDVDEADDAALLQRTRGIDETAR